MKIGQEGIECSLRTEGEGTADFCCDKSGRGLFCLTDDRTEWRQVEGLCDTPVFRSVGHLRNYIADRYVDVWDPHATTKETTMATDVILLHDRYDPAHLAEVTEEMRTRGAPVIRAVYMEVWGLWMALEGCHRLRAAHALGLEPEIVPVDYDEDAVIGPSTGYDPEMDDTTIGNVASDAYRRTVLRFPVA